MKGHALGTPEGNHIGRNVVYCLELPLADAELPTVK